MVVVTLTVVTMVTLSAVTMVTLTVVALSKRDELFFYSFLLKSGKERRSWVVLYSPVTGSYFHSLSLSLIFLKRIISLSLKLVLSFSLFLYTNTD